MDDQPTSKWEAFWEASSLSSATARQFGERARAFVPLDPPPEPFVQAGPEFELRSKRDRLQKLFHKRSSTRTFGESPLTLTQLGELLAAFEGRSSGRVYPSAGGLYPVHIFAMVLNGEAPHGGHALRYEPSTHSVGRLRSLPDIPTVEQACSIETGIHPQMIVVFVIDPEELERKYGERAGRFALIEVGHAAQNLALRISQSGYRGYELGGLHDSAVREMLGLQQTEALIAHGYAVGV